MIMQILLGPRNLPSTSHGVTPTLKSFIILLVFWCTWVQFIVYNTLRKTNKWWKTLFYHFLDIAHVNAFILFEDFRKKHADIPELQRPDRYWQLDFTTELIRQLADLDVHADVPLVWKKCVLTMHSIIPVMTKERKYCKKCYKEKQKEQKTNVRCMGCETYLCFQSDRNCLLSFHEC